MRAALAALTPQQRRMASQALCARLAALEALREARRVLVYLPLPREIDILPFAHQLLADGVTVAVPRVIAPARAPHGRPHATSDGQQESGVAQVTEVMEAVVVERLPCSSRSRAGGAAGDAPSGGEGEGFIRDALGVRSPIAGQPIPLHTLDAMIIPGLAFDASGSRLGRGGGYYDRTLAACGPRTLVIGVGFDCQLVAAVPTDPHDIRVHVVVTDRRVVGGRGV